MRNALTYSVLALALLAPAASGRAQVLTADDVLTPEDFAVNRFHPANGPGNFFAVDGAVVGGHLSPSVGIVVDYAHRPFVLNDATCSDATNDECDLKDSTSDLVAYQLTTTPMATLTIIQRLQFGIALPLVLTDGDSFSSSLPYMDAKFVDIRGRQAFSMGDPRLSAKVRMVGKGNQGFFLAAAVYMSAPLGNALVENGNVGDDGFTGGGHLIPEYRAGKFRVAANLGGIARPTRSLLSTEVGPEMTYGVAGSYDVTELLRVLGEVNGATQFTQQVDENPVEVMVGAALSQGDFVIDLGIGTGLVSGVGVPNFRALAGASWQPQGLDTDGDGIRDKDDNCITEPEDMDGYLDDDGCPDTDNDGDGLPDTADQCPDEPEDPDGFQDQDGCPDRDNDNDGVQDGYDSCPDEPEDKDGDRDDDGCPDNDRDRDGVPDDVDKCPDEPEDTDGYGDDDGCPETDFDGDNVPDDEDQCPDQPEDLDGFEDEDGCPEEGEAPDTTRERTRG